MEQKFLSFIFQEKVHSLVDISNLMVTSSSIEIPFKHLKIVLKYEHHYERNRLIYLLISIQAAKEALDKGKSVVIDNTNPGADTRSEYIALAKSHKVPCRCFVLNTPIELCHHLNYVRVHQNLPVTFVEYQVCCIKILFITMNLFSIVDVGYNMYKEKLCCTQPK